MVEKEIELIIKRFILELKNEGIKIVKIFLFGSYAMGTLNKKRVLSLHQSKVIE